MRTLASLALATSLALGGCVHSPQVRSHARTAGLTAAVIAGLVILTGLAQCGQCGDPVIGPKDGGR